MNEWIIAFITIFGTVASVSGVVVYVFNGTRSLIREIHETTKAMHTTAIEMQRESEQRHREAMDWFKRSDERAEQSHQDVVGLLKQQHQDVVELLKKGFGAAAT